MLRAICPGHASMDVGLGLPHIQMTPDPIVSMILDQTAFPAGWTGQSTRSMVHEHMDLLSSYGDIDSDDVPGFLELEQSGKELGVVHAA
jgi:hypothetical protein